MMQQLQQVTLTVKVSWLNVFLYKLEESLKALGVKQ
jgi:hypothetical protein